MVEASASATVGAAPLAGGGAPPPVVRLAGLPAVALADLCGRDSAALAERLVVESRSLAEAGESLSAALFDQIGAARGTALAPRLVGLRRSLHRSRAPARSEWSDQVRAALPAPLVAQVDRWLIRHRRLGRDQARLPGLLARDVRAQHAALRRLAADPGFRRALWLSSRSLAGEVDKWLADPARSLRPQAAFRLAKYLARAATKPSPHSTFAMSGFGVWDGGAAIRLAEPGTPTGVLELHGGLVEQLLEALAGQAQLWSTLALRVNPSATEEAGRVGFLGRAPAEPVLHTPVTPTLAVCLRLVAAGSPARVGQVREQLTGAAGVDLAGADRLLRQLVRAGLLEVWPDTGAAPERLTAVAAWLRRAVGGGPLTGACDRIATALREPVPVADVDGYRRRQETLRNSVEAVLRELGTERPAGGYGPVAVDTAVVPHPLAECDPVGWAPVLADLDSYRRWLAGFSPALPVRLALADCWGGRLGSAGEMPLLHFHHAIQRQLHTGDPASLELRRLLAGRPTDLAGSAFPRVRELYRRREQALAAFRAGTERPVLARDLAATEWPVWVPPIGSMGCYLQPLPRAGGLAAVLNAVDTGYGKGANRVGYLLRRAGTQLPVRTWRAVPGEPVPAELSGAYGSTLNHRLPTAPYELDYPFTAATGLGRPASHRLPLADLVVTCDPASRLLRLRSRRLGAEVRALDLGLLVRPLLPPAARLLGQVFGDLPMLRPPELLPPLAGPATAGVRRLPRVWAGRLLLRRACWVAPCGSVPRRAGGERDADYLLRLLAWRDSHGLPGRCFFRLLPVPDGPATPERLSFDKARKPSYLDFASWLLVRAFENALTGRDGLVVIEEAVPDPAQTGAGGGGRVAELLFEVAGSELRHDR